ncbi:hypothetical protein ZYGR_0H01040 [Zygosaccharomyces rouxii]|uniref:Ubiquinone biosynthesis O-methyltransferase, mitochondrial n=2 Tax=Zygosaccharomyces rouxii TaxID=4956 RepID=C5DR84_ZYGRC|nr:uncharacterized protein ZYRO0B06336g [Zygosaccharomyces rouxii]KAH9200160.1 S-adenosyl-L-methionine-dependent methyltransferase [Zygosaccharomyces rouxii]GAV47263.1 hypothetical protein ZYGR_0H01040 [Zygosaccharomyces rouxii]CAR26295.1 ZYRO0B06336p [Zygosaccharomyces rouxii]
MIPRVTVRRLVPQLRPGVASLRFKTTSASKDEIGHFQELAPTWWDVNGSQRILHLMNNSRLDFIQRIIRQSVKVEDPDTYIPGFQYKAFFPQQVSQGIEDDLDSKINEKLKDAQFNVLDIGCGGGILAECLARLPITRHVTGVDLTPDVIKVAREHSAKDPALSGKLEYRLQALEEVEGTYDLVTCFEMLEHVDVPAEILRHAWMRLKPQGILFLSTINRDFISWFTTIFMGEYVLKVVPKGTHHLTKYIKSSEIKEWFQENEPHTHKILDTKGVMYRPFNGWAEHDCPDIGNYFMAIKKLN